MRNHHSRACVCAYVYMCDCVCVECVGEAGSGGGEEHSAELRAAGGREWQAAGEAKSYERHV